MNTDEKLLKWAMEYKEGGIDARQLEKHDAKICLLISAFWWPLVIIFLYSRGFRAIY